MYKKCAVWKYLWILPALILLFPGFVKAESLEDIPEYEGEAYTEISENVPDFPDEMMTAESYETYSELDDLGRCGPAEACIGTDLMPTEKRGAIGSVKPSGWHTVKYDCVDGKYLYNRCHLIGYQLTGENANEQNLITGTRYLNVEGMLPFENMVADYVKETGNHVLYRVTPVFDGDNLVADGVQMEAKSVEDDGEGIEFNVFCYNVQPGVEIDYAAGESRESGTKDQKDSAEKENKEITYILNKNTHKFHYPDCPAAKQTKPKNKEEFFGTRDEIVSMGYDPCGKCKP